MVTISRDKLQEAIKGAIHRDGKFSGMTYEQGVEEALEWVLGNITDEDFACYPNK